MSKKDSNKKDDQRSVYKKLKADHQKVESLFKTLLKSDESETDLRNETFFELKELLEVHADAEEEIFYPLTEREESTQALTLEAYEEHKIVRNLLAEISELEPHDKLWSAKIKVLSEAVKHHVREEEKQMFPLAKKYIEKDKAVCLGVAVERFESHQLSDQSANTN